MGDHDAPEPTMPHGCASFVYHLNEDVSARHVEIAWVNGTGNGEHGKLGRAVEVADRGDAMRARPVDDLGAEGPARTDPPEHLVPFKEPRLLIEQCINPDTLAPDCSRRHDERVEVEQSHLMRGRKHVFRMMTAVDDRRA